jgi:acyl carrier protein
MSVFTDSEIDAVYQLVQDALGASDLSREELKTDAQWTSHQTLDIIFGAESIFGIQFSSEQMETIDGVEALLVALASSRAFAEQAQA